MDEEEDPEEDEPFENGEGNIMGKAGEEAVEIQNAEETGVVANENNGVHNGDIAVFQQPAFGLNLFEGLDDEDLIQLIRNSGFLVPEDVDTQEEIISRLRQLDQN